MLGNAAIINKKGYIAIGIIALLCFLLASCNSSTISIGSSGTDTASFGTTSNGGSIGSGSQGLKVVVEPDASDQFLVDAIDNANKSVWVEMYLLTDKKIISALEDAANNGKDVRVMLEPHPYGGGSVSPKETLDKLNAAGVKTETTSSAFALTHEKGMIIDASTAYIMTSNFTLAALGRSTSLNNREYDIIDTNAPDVQAVISIFNADWNRQTAQFNDDNLVVSPTNSRSDFGALIDSAHKTLLVEAEEMQDSQIEQDLTNAEKRGVKVQVILPKSQSGNSDSNSDGINTLKQSGVQVEEDPKLYMHAKIIVADGQKAFVGSENISSSSLDKNRELGILISDQTVLNTLQQTFQQDWNTSQAA